MRTLLRIGPLRLLLVGLLACAPAGDTEVVPRSTLFVGIDVSASFQKDGRYDDAIVFAAHYIHGRLTGAGELEQPRTLFVGSIGGAAPGQTQAFHPIHDFEGKTPAEIEADLRTWFGPHDQLTDFNAFFRRAATLVQRQSLALAPVTLVLLTDGVPDLGGQGAAVHDAERYADVDVEPLEYLARNVTVRVLYPDPTVAVHWERSVPRDRVRMWTVDAVVMEGWREQLREPEVAVAMAPEARGGDAIDDPLTAGVEPLSDTAQPALEDGDTTAGDTTTGADETPAGDTAEAADTGIAIRGVQLSATSGSRGSTGVSVQAGAGVVEQPALWRWIKDNVDFRVRRTIF